MKILAVCGMGLGSGLILKIQMEKAIKQLGLTADVEVADISTARALAHQADIILTSKELADRLGDVKAKIITITNYMDIQEMVDKLKEAIA
ncbi:MAG: PTS sugar transporter subunit IIB [Chloroflexota bacterium]